MPEELLLTPAGLDKLKQELEEANTRRLEIIERIKIAKDFGDLSENAEYEEAKKQQSFIEGRIQELKAMIKKARVISGHKDKSKVEIGDIVEVESEGDRISYEIVGATESNPEEGKISLQSPIAKALMGAKVGDVVKAPVPDGVIELKVLKIK